MSQTTVVQKIKTHFTFNTVEPQFTNASLHEQIFRKQNISGYERCFE
jgi:hypothetical protein